MVCVHVSVSEQALDRRRRLSLGTGWAGGGLLAARSGPQSWACALFPLKSESCWFLYKVPLKGNDGLSESGAFRHTETCLSSF